MFLVIQAVRSKHRAAGPVYLCLPLPKTCLEWHWNQDKKQKDVSDPGTPVGEGRGVETEELASGDFMGRKGSLRAARKQSGETRTRGWVEELDRLHHRLVFFLRVG